MPVIPSNWEVETGRIIVPDWTREKVRETSSQPTSWA
jgi:hypothetical protein